LVIRGFAPCLVVATKKAAALIARQPN
jgi:hypothetical protein